MYTVTYILKCRFIYPGNILYNVSLLLIMLDIKNSSLTKKAFICNWGLVQSGKALGGIRNLLATIRIGRLSLARKRDKVE